MRDAPHGTSEDYQRLPDQAQVLQRWFDSFPPRRDVTPPPEMEATLEMRLESMLTRKDAESHARTRQKTAREYQRALEQLTASVSRALAAMDTVMKRPESVQRGEALARIANGLDLANDRALYFSLGKSFAAIHREKHRLLAEIRDRQAQRRQA